MMDKREAAKTKLFSAYLLGRALMTQTGMTKEDFEIEENTRATDNEED